MNRSANTVCRGLWRHLCLTLRLNFRSRQALIYGYLVPIFFLFGFGSVFGGGTPPLLRELGQLLTITILGGACFGMPTATVAERERGVWRRYRLLPGSAVGIALSTLFARFGLILSATVLQLVLARVVYGTPWPVYPVQWCVAFAAAAFAFLGLGWLIAMLADNVPAVQALGQAVFLPMIMVGGVGVPLGMLPPWAQHVAAFLPGHYAVEALEACILPGGGGVAGARFAFGALVVIGAAGFLAAGGLFRWEAGPRPLDWRARGWIALALLSWVGIGAISEARRLNARKSAMAPAAERSTPAPSAMEPASPAPASPEPWRGLPAAELASITFDDLSPDVDRILPFASDYDSVESVSRKKRLEQIQDQLAYWNPGTAAVEPKTQRVQNLLSVCAMADLVLDPNEREISLVVFDQFKDAVRDPVERQQVLGWIILHPAEGTVLTDMSEFGIGKSPPEPLVRQRVVGYAKKFLRKLRE